MYLLWAHWLSDSCQRAGRDADRPIWCRVGSSYVNASQRSFTHLKTEEAVVQGKLQHRNPMSPSVSAKQMPYCPQSLPRLRFISSPSLNGTDFHTHSVDSEVNKDEDRQANAWTFSLT